MFGVGIKRPTSVSLAFCCFLFLTAAWPQSRPEVVSPELDSLLRAVGPNEPLAIIVRFADGVEPSELGPEPSQRARRAKLITAMKNKAAETQAAFAPLANAEGAQQVKSLWLINGLALTVRARSVRSLAAWHRVESISLDGKMSAPQPALASPTSPEWNLLMIKAPALWNIGYTGQGVVVAVLDTGVDPNHVDLGPRWRAGANSWLDPNGEHVAPYDADGHGTHVTGLILGGDGGGASIGVAPGAQWIAAKMYDDRGYAEYSDIHQSLQWTLDPDGDPTTDDAAHVVNCSWGFADNPNQCRSEFRQDIQVLDAAGIHVVFAAGNSGPAPSTSLSPANYTESIAVGAVDPFGEVASFSARGPAACDGSIFPELVAPGVNVRTTDLTFGGVFPRSYVTMSGTSAAAPHLTGSIALLISAFPSVGASRLRLAVLASGQDVAEPGPDNDGGYGLIDVVAAYDWLRIDLGTGGIDADGDGFIQSQDCNDDDASVHPGAAEIKNDGVDQDCNGYDLTIDVCKAMFQPRVNVLIIEATSALGPLAKLELLGYGPMTWDRRKSKWTITVRGVADSPSTVTVSGVEGAETAKVR